MLATLTRYLGPGVPAALVAGLIVAVDDVAYGTAIAGQGTGFDRRVIFAATLLGLIALLAFLGALQRQPRVRAGFLSLVAAGCLGLGVLGIFSIGLPLLAAGGLTMYAVSRSSARAHRLMLLSGAVTGLAILVIGFRITDVSGIGVTCPPQGSSHGFVSSGGLTTTWTCVDGTLTEQAR